MVPDRQRDKITIGLLWTANFFFRTSHLTRVDDDVNVGRVGEVRDWSTRVGAWEDKISTLDA